MPDPPEFVIHDAADSLVEQEAAVLDWGLLVTEPQGGPEVFLVGQSRPTAARLLRDAANALDAITERSPQSPIAVMVPVGVLEELARDIDQLCDAAEHGEDAGAVAKAMHPQRARQLYAAARGEQVDWSAVGAR